MKQIELEDNTYELIKNEKDGYDEEAVKEKYTDYYADYDYIVGDIAYSKLRLKGFYDPSNKKVTDINNYKNAINYIEKYCAYGCKHFILKKITNSNSK